MSLAPSSPPARTNAISASNASHSSAVISSPSSRSESARLTIATIRARSEASTNRRSSSSRFSIGGAEGDDDKAIVAVSLGAPRSPDLAARIDPGEAGWTLSECGDERLDLRFRRPVGELRSPSSAVEDEGGLGRVRQPAERSGYRGLRALHDRFGCLVADIDGRVPLDGRSADEAAVGRACADVPRYDITVQLRLAERMVHRQRLEVGLAQLHS